MSPQPRAVRLPVFIDDAVLDEDLQHVTPAARAAFGAWRSKVTREHGILTSELRTCRDDARDGTSLAGLVKTYVPWPTGQWGTVMLPARTPANPLELHVIAYGVRHPSGRTPSVYKLAHDRTHDTA